MPTSQEIFHFGIIQNKGENRGITLGRLGIMVALAAVYFILGKLGLRLAFVNASATAIWPPTGLAIAAVLLLGYDALAAVFVGAFLVNVTVAGGVAGSLAIAAGNTLEAFIAVYLVNKYANGRQAFESSGDIFRFAILAGLASTMVAAAIGVGSLFAGGLADVAQLSRIWFTWWLGDAGGALIFAPFIVLWLEGGRYHWKAEDNTVAGAFLLLLLIVTGVIFEHWIPAPFGGYPLAFLIVPPLMWAAYRFGRRITTAATVLLSIVAVVSAYNEPDSWTAGGTSSALLFLQFFLSFVAVANLMFAAVIYQQRKGERALAENEKRFRSLVENSSDGIAMLDGEGTIHYASPAVKHIVGYEPAELIGRKAREIIFDEDGKRFAGFVKDLAGHRHATVMAELRIVQKGGAVRWIECAAVDLLDDPTVEAVVANFRDITERKQAAAAKNNFISSVSYRLSPPLAQAETYIAALRERKKSFSPLEQKYLMELDAANHKMITLTSDIIRLARIELGTIRTAPKLMDLRKIVEETLRGLAGKAQARSVRVVWEHPPARTFLCADPSLLGLALQRMAAKLLTLVPEKGTLHVTLAREEKQVFLQFFSPSVRDLRGKLQMNLEEAETAGEKKESELAFGFYMLQSLIELMEGKIYFESAADGSEMLTIAFPQSSVEAADAIPGNRTAATGG